MRDPIEDEFVSCKRTVPQPTLIDRDSRKYWTDLFKMIDLDNKIPSYRRLNVLKEVFKEEILRRILKIISVDPTLEDKVAEKIRIKGDGKRTSKVDIGPVRSQILITDATEKSKKRTDFRTKLLNQLDSQTQCNNFYMNFMNLPYNIAQKWRPKPPLTFKGMNLNEKCEAITLSIATSFIDWLKGLGGDEIVTLSVPVILNLFEVGFNAHAADSLCVRIMELNAVTKSIANARQLPGASYTSHLYRQLYRDINASKPRDEMFAFGTMLPPDMRPPPQRENIAAKWITNARVPQKIANMAVIWEGIEDLKSTRGFCKWLKAHPDIEPPEYLIQAGLIKESGDQDSSSSSSG